MPHVLIISTHDFRSLRKASVHFIAAEFGRRHPTRFLSIGLSDLSIHRGDTRADLAGQAGRVVRHDNVDCFLWKTRWHPFNVRRDALLPVERAMFRCYRAMLPNRAWAWIEQADVVLIESGMAAAFIGYVHWVNPRARLVYLASDDLDVVGAARTIIDTFRRDYDLLDTVRLPSRFLADAMPHTRNAYLIPHGVDHGIAGKSYPNPYGARPACVAVGSMLFDRTFFEFAAPQFPELDFHVIGAGAAAAGLSAPNIVIHPETAFADTLPFVRHARFGIAPYRDAETPRYLIDTSLKLRQFSLFGIPAVCPTFAVGDVSGRFGYETGDRDSIRRAIDGALSHRAPITHNFLSWSDVVDRIELPACYADTELRPAIENGGP